MKISEFLRAGQAASPSLKEKIKEFFIKNPYPNDNGVHKFAEDLKVSPHDLETEIYSLLSDLLSK